MTPVISASSSILGFRRDEPFEFQPAATNTPTSWAAVGLPSGVTINTTTGLISGSAATAGVYVVTVSATNDTGTGTREFVIGISSEVYVPPASGIGDTIVLMVSLPDLTVTGAVPLKYGDTRMLSVRFMRDGQRVELDLDTLKLALKQREPEGVLVVADDFEQVGAGATAEYLLPVTLTGTALSGVLAEEEADAGTSFSALAELEWTREITWGTGTKELKSSTPTFPVTIARDLVAG